MFLNRPKRGAFLAHLSPPTFDSAHPEPVEGPGYDSTDDVIAWTDEGTPPPTAFYFGQTASGKNWPGKPVADHARVFGAAYMQDHMTGNRLYVTLIPYRVLDTAFWNSQHLFHWAILDRLRLPRRAWQGVQLAGQGVAIDGADHINDVEQWLGDFIDYAQAA